MRPEKNGHCRILNHQGTFRSKQLKNREESAFYKHIANSHKELYKEGGELEQHFTFEVLKVFKFPLDCEVDEGVRMVMYKGVIIKWFSPSIVRTTIEKEGVEMAYEPARGFRQTSSRTQSTRHPGGRTDRSHQPSSESNVSSQPGCQAASRSSSSTDSQREKDEKEGSQ